MDENIPTSGSNSINILSIENVTKFYRTLTSKFKAVDNLSLSVKRGECFGLIGVNGAGKSTTFKMVLGALTPGDGDVLVSCQRIGYCPQQNSIDPFIKTSKLLEIYCLLSGFTLDESKCIA